MGGLKNKAESLTPHLSGYSHRQVKGQHKTWMSPGMSLKQVLDPAPRLEWGPPGTASPTGEVSFSLNEFC